MKESNLPYKLSVRSMGWVLVPAIFLLLGLGIRRCLDDEEGRRAIGRSRLAAETSAAYLNPFRLSDFRVLALLEKSSSKEPVRPVPIERTKTETTKSKVTPAPVSESKQEEQKADGASAEAAEVAAENIPDEEPKVEELTAKAVPVAGGGFGGLLLDEVSAPNPFEAPSRPNDPAVPEINLQPKAPKKPGARRLASFSPSMTAALLGRSIVNVNSTRLRVEGISALPFVGAREIERYRAFRRVFDERIDAASSERLFACALTTCIALTSSSPLFGSKDAFFDVLGISKDRRKVLESLVTLNPEPEDSILHPVYFPIVPIAGPSFEETIYLGSAPIEPLPKPYSENMRKMESIDFPGSQAIEVHFADFNTEEGFDFLTFRDYSAAGKGAELAQFSGDVGDFSIGFSTDRLALDFQSDGSINSTGYTLDYVRVFYEDLPSIIRVAREVRLASSEASVEDLMIEQPGAKWLNIRIKTFRAGDPKSHIEVYNGKGEIIRILTQSDTLNDENLFADANNIQTTDTLIFRFSDRFQGNFEISDYRFKPEAF